MKRQFTMKNKEVECFEKLYYQLQPRLYAYCRKYINDKEQAKDIVQECFISLWENFNTVNTSPEFYLFKSIHNRCISHFRSIKTKVACDDTIDIQLAEMGIHSELHYPLVELYLNDINTLLQQTIEGLPEKCKQIFILSRYHGLKNQEIAEKLSISVRTVESQIYNALKILKNTLKDYLLSIFL
jgi:RNA polymerase sigma-70 factor (ECF subfamily)